MAKNIKVVQLLKVEIFVEVNQRLVFSQGCSLNVAVCLGQILICTQASVFD